MFAQRLKQLRLDAGYNNQESIAKKLGTTQQSYSQWESGKRTPNSESLKKLATFFNVPVDYLLGQTTNTANITGENNKIIQVDTNNNGINFYQDDPQDTEDEMTHRTDIMELLTEMVKTQKEILKELKKINKK